MSYYSATSVEAAGSDSAGATQLTDPYNDVNSGSGGVILPEPNYFSSCKIINSTLGSIQVYPGGGMSINGATTDEAFTLNSLSTCVCITDTFNWVLFLV